MIKINKKANLSELGANEYLKLLGYKACFVNKAEL